jgi:hypothetical protein
MGVILGIVGAIILFHLFVMLLPFIVVIGMGLAGSFVGLVLYAMMGGESGAGIIISVVTGFLVGLIVSKMRQRIILITRSHKQNTILPLTG